MRALSVAILLFGLAIVSCATPPATGQQSPEIAARSDAWELAFQSADANAITTFYTADARIMPPNSPMGTGHDAVRELFQGMFDAGLTGELTTLEAVMVGDVGYNVGTYALQTADGEIADRGKFIEIWRLVDGEWLISNDTFNSDMPATAGSEEG